MQTCCFILQSLIYLVVQILIPKAEGTSILKDKRRVNMLSKIFKEEKKQKTNSGWNVAHKVQPISPKLNNWFSKYPKTSLYLSTAVMMRT
jgi:hypothetical protein